MPLSFEVLSLIPSIQPPNPRLRKEGLGDFRYASGKRILWKDVPRYNEMGNKFREKEGMREMRVTWSTT